MKIGVVLIYWKLFSINSICCLLMTSNWTIC